MNIQRLVRLPFAGAAALAMLGISAAAFAQTAPAQPAASQQFYPSTVSSATYKLPEAILTVNSGMPKLVNNYGQPPSFKALDANHDGRLTETEAQAYAPLDNDFLFASKGGKTISMAQYETWAKNQ